MSVVRGAYPISWFYVNGDRGEEAIGRTPGGTQGTYMDDPAGYVIQYITEGMQ